MTDILERLRKRMTSHELHYIPDPMSQDAADEIERLRIMVATRDQEIANNQRRLKEESDA